MPLDDEIDVLYQVPADEFTAARNGLAKRAGSRAADVRQLAKPSAAAWAINQVYWHRRPVFDALAKASEARRAAHVRQLRGEAVDPSLADAKHRAALDTALEAAAAFLRDAGDALSSATLDAIGRTLEAVPSESIRGRLTRPVDPSGFSMLASLLASSGPPSTPGTPADVVVMPRRKPRSADTTGNERAAAAGARAEQRQVAAEARRAAAARARKRDILKKSVTSARATERQASKAFAAARKAVEAADARIDGLEKELSAARRALDERRAHADRARLALNDAAAARVTLERDLRELE